MSEKLTTEEVREYFAYVHDAHEHLSGPSEERARAFDAWLEGVIAQERQEARQEVVNNLAKARILAPSARDDYMACPADCALEHAHIARMSGDPYYWSGND